MRTSGAAEAPASAADVVAAFDAQDYLTDDGLATAVLLAMRMGRPLFLEGEPGTGKTEVAKVLANWTGGPLVRLQCYDGIDLAQAAYEWDHARQLLHLRVAEAAGVGRLALEAELYDPRFLLRRPLLQAISPVEGPPPILLIDEVDRADDEFEALLLEVLSDWSISVPELGTIHAERPPVVVLTSNRTRDVHDALKRRCLYHWLEHPDRPREVAIIRRRVPDAAARLATQVAAAAGQMRALGLYKPPGIAESIDWARALVLLGCRTLDPEHALSTLGVVLKYREDADRVRAGLDDVLAAESGTS